MTRALALAALGAISCARSAALHIDVSETAGAPAPATLKLTVLDAHGRIVDGASLGDHPQLPGDVTVLVDPGPIRAFILGKSDGGKGLWAVGKVSVAIGADAEMAMQLVAGNAPDQDGDGVPDPVDNCPTVPNPDQASESGSVQGDACRTANAGVDGAGGSDGSDGGSDGSDGGFIAPLGCGDGTVDPGEECDDGAANSDDPASSARCTTGCRVRAHCGPLQGAAAAMIDPATGHCYVAWSVALPWAFAQRACQAAGGDLAIVSSQGEADLLRGLAGGTQAWIGVTTPPGPVAFVNVDGTAPPVFPWSPGEPDGKGHCVSLATDGWHSDDCGMPSNGGLAANALKIHPFLCESACGNGKVDPGETCDPPGPGCSKTCHKLAACGEAGAVSVPENGHCYFKTAATFTYALALASGCPSGTHLATLQFPVETEAALAVAGNSDSWIAMSAAQTLGVFSWDVGSEIFDATRYHGFGGNDPNDAPPACVSVTNNPPSGLPGWRDRDCAPTTIYPAICERDQ